MVLWHSHTGPVYGHWPARVVGLPPTRVPGARPAWTSSPWAQGPVASCGGRHAGRSCPSETQTEVHQATWLLPALRQGGMERLDLAQLGPETLIFQADRWGAESRREGEDQPAIFYTTLIKAHLKVKEEPWVRTEDSDGPRTLVGIIVWAQH